MNLKESIVKVRAAARPLTYLTRRIAETLTRQDTGQRAPTGPTDPTANSIRVLTAAVPVSMLVPNDMTGAVAEVLSGEYESGFSGSGLTVLDIGANVGSFAIWAGMRWPQSTVHCYEPHPGTFRLLEQNTSDRSGVIRHNVAVFPTEGRRLPLFQRYDGDGESGLAHVMSRYFNEGIGSTVEVDVVHPSELPSADVVKIDVEGVEAAILEHLDLTDTGLILLEYQDDRNKEAVLRVLADDFVLEYEDAYLWDDILGGDYRADLAGDHYGHLVFSSRHSHRLVRTGSAGPLSSKGH
jgi:FkbM family methyltransferase